MSCSLDHKVVDSRFCPDCGKKLNQATVDEILAYFRKTVRTQQSTLTRLKERRDQAIRAEKPDGLHGYRVLNKEIEHKKPTVTRWKKWLAVMEELILEKKEEAKRCQNTNPQK